jgi:hypothetical protein
LIAFAGLLAADCACANIVLIASAELFAWVDADFASFADVALDDADDEFVLNNNRRLAADKPPKAFNEESMSDLFPPLTRIVESSLVA